MSIFLCSRVIPVFCSGVFLTQRIVAVGLEVRNPTSTTNSLDLLLGIKRMGEHIDEVPDLFSNNECTVCALNSLDAATAEMSNVHSLAEKPDHSREAL